MRIGIVGLGVVGEAIKHGFQKLGHEIYVHDIAFDTKLEDVLKSNIVFITVPSPRSSTGLCDTSIVEAVVGGLVELQYEGIIAIKSTVSPGTTNKLISTYSNAKICFVPEFLRERYAVSDFTEKQDLCVIGTSSKLVFEIVKMAHGSLPKEVVQLRPTEAELCKYFNNIYNATLITFANSFRKICEYYGEDYTNVKNATTYREHIKDMYLESNDHFKGFGGVCLPKDTSQMAEIGKKIGVDFFDMIMKENAKIEMVVQEGMRKE